LLVNAFFVVPAAHAAGTEPNGLVVPRGRSDPAAPDFDPAYAETRLKAFFTGEGETFDRQIDAQTSPSTFVPACAKLDAACPAGSFCSQGRSRISRRSRWISAATTRAPPPRTAEAAAADAARRPTAAAAWVAARTTAHHWSCS
jgi:hypothetical protein